MCACENDCMWRHALYRASDHWALSSESPLSGDITHGAARGHRRSQISEQYFSELPLCLRGWVWCHASDESRSRVSTSDTLSPYSCPPPMEFRKQLHRDLSASCRTPQCSGTLRPPDITSREAAEATAMSSS